MNENIMATQRVLWETGEGCRSSFC